MTDLEKKQFDFLIIGGIEIDTNVFLKTPDIDYTIEVNFTDNIDYIGQTGGYSSRLIAQLGYKIAFIGYIGNDFSGEYIKSELRKDKINIDCLFIDPAGTKRSINIVYPNGTRKNFYDAKSSMESKIDINACKNILQHGKIAHFSIVNWTRYLLPIAKELGLIISVDLQDIITFEDNYRTDYIKFADIIFFSAVNVSDIEGMIQKFLIINPNQIIIVGMGSKGCALGYKGTTHFFNPIQMEAPVIDSNGAGDSLAVGFLSSYYIQNKDIFESIYRAQVLARYICTIKASTSNMVSISSYEKLINDLRNQHFK